MLKFSFVCSLMTEISYSENKNCSYSIFQESDRDIETFLVFTIAGQKAAISVDAIKEIALPASLDKLPNHIDQVVGLMNLRGDIIPVIDLAGKGLGSCGSNNQHKKRVIVIPLGETKIGLLVENYMQITTGIKVVGSSKKFNNNDMPLFRPYTKSVVKDRTGHTIPLLDNIQLFEQLMARMADNVCNAKASTTVSGKEEVRHG